MHARSHRLQSPAATVVLAAMVALGAPSTTFARASTAPSQPSATTRLLRQEDARATELARFEASARQRSVTTTLDARERAMSKPPADRSATTADRRSAGDGGFAWGAAALGLGAGVVAMCVLLGSVTRVRGHGLRSA